MPITMVYLIEKLTILPLCMLWVRRVEGADNLPKQGAFIIAANHSSYFDIFLPACVALPKLNRRMHALVNGNYWKNPLNGALLNHWQCLPVFAGKDRESKEKNKIAFENALNYLKKNEIMVIFPEGRRSPDGKLQKAYPGTARLALKAKVPVLPIGIIGSDKVLPKGKFFPRLRRCEIKIGKPIKFEDKKPTKKIFEEATRDIMAQIAGLVGQKYNY